MATTTKRAVCLMQRNYTVLGVKRIHSSTRFLAKAAPKRSPRVVRSSGPESGKIRVRKTYDIEESLPPVDLLKTAQSSGAYSIDPENALEFLREYQQQSKKESGWEQQLCANHNITPSDVELLSNILRRCDTKAQRSLAKSLMLSASNLGLNSATFALIKSGLNTGSLQDLQVPLYRLGLLAKSQNPQAMSLLGQFLLTQSKDKEALEYFRKATSPPTGNLDFDGAGEALVNQGAILLRQGDKEAAKTAFSKAAFELDDPSGYFYLSQLVPANSAQQEEYLLKSATSGITQACHNLGALELSKVDEKKTSGSRMALEWFKIAAHDGFGLSMLNLALLYKNTGNLNEAQRWIEAAKQVPDVLNEALALEKSWTDEDFTPGTVL